MKIVTVAQNKIKGKSLKEKDNSLANTGLCLNTIRISSSYFSTQITGIFVHTHFL